MKCPKCLNKNFVPSRDFKRPLINLGFKEHYDTFNVRRYSCVECGYVFKTKEVFYMEVQVRSNQMNLFEGTDGHRPQAAD